VLKSAQLCGIGFPASHVVFLEELQYHSCANSFTYQGSIREEIKKKAVKKRHPVEEDTFNLLTVRNTLLNQLIATLQVTLCSLRSTAQDRERRDLHIFHSPHQWFRLNRKSL